MKIDGIDVVDATKKLTIRITEDDVKKGGVKDAKACAAARAIKRIGHFKNARVHVSRTYVQDKEGNWRRYMTPMALQKEIISFDRGGTFTPGVYQLGVPCESQLTGARAARSNKKQIAKYRAAEKTKRRKAKRFAAHTTAIRDRMTGFGKYDHRSK